jgi:ATP-binding cassette subfamily F protein 3
VKPHIGDIYSFLQERKIANLAELEKVNLQNKEAKQNKTVEPKVEAVKTDDREKKKSQQSIQKIEQQISDAEKKLAEMDALLINPETFEKHNNPAFYKDYDTVKSSIEELMKKWEEMQ